MAVIKIITAMEARKRFGEIMNRVALRGERYIVKRAGKSLVSIGPVIPGEASRPVNWNDPFENPLATFTEWNDPADDIYDKVARRIKKKGSTMKDILNRMRFRDPDKNLSQHVDQIVYGGRR